MLLQKDDCRPDKEHTDNNFPLLVLLQKDDCRPDEEHTDDNFPLLSPSPLPSSSSSSLSPIIQEKSNIVTVPSSELRSITIP